MSKSQNDISNVETQEISSNSQRYKPFNRLSRLSTRDIKEMKKQSREKLNNYINTQRDFSNSYSSSSSSSSSSSNSGIIRDRDRNRNNSSYIQTPDPKKERSPFDPFASPPYITHEENNNDKRQSFNSPPATQLINNGQNDDIVDIDSFSIDEIDNFDNLDEIQNMTTNDFITINNNNNNNNNNNSSNNDDNDGNDGNDGNDDDMVDINTLGTVKINTVNFKVVNDDTIRQRLDSSWKSINDHLNIDDPVKGFYSLMAFLEKSYSVKLLTNDASKLVNGFNTVTVDDVGTIGKVLNFMKNVPHPGTSSSYKSRDMFDMRSVIPVGNTTRSDNAPFFYCIIGENDGICKENVISYSDMNIARDTVNKTSNRYIITKYTDRPTMRLNLLISLKRDENMTNFALFVMENLHMITINKKYIRKEGRIIIFDLYSFLINVFSHYTIHDNLLNYHNFLNIAQKKTLNMLNQRIDDIGLRIGDHVISDDTTIAYVYWLYEMRYINYTYTDNSWISRSLIIKTTKDSAIEQLASYQIYRTSDYGEINRLNIDCEYTITFNDDVQDIDISKFKLDNDLEIFYETRSDEEQKAIRKYLNYIFEGINNDNVEYYDEDEDEIVDKRYTINMFFIYPLIYSSINNENGKYISMLKQVLYKGVTDNINILDLILQLIPLDAKEIKKDEKKKLYIEEKPKEVISEKIYKVPERNIVKNKYFEQKKKEIKKDSSNVVYMEEERKGKVYFQEKKKEKPKEVAYTRNTSKIKKSRNIYIPPKSKSDIIKTSTNPLNNTLPKNPLQSKKNLVFIEMKEGSVFDDLSTGKKEKEDTIDVDNNKEVNKLSRNKQIKVDTKKVKKRNLVNIDKNKIINDELNEVDKKILFNYYKDLEEKGILGKK